jgi:hypothetical protein
MKIKNQNQKLIPLLGVLLIVSMFSQITPFSSALTGSEDGYEENDTQLSATEIFSDGTLVMCSWDDDWFKVWVNASTLFSAMIGFNGTEKNLDITIWNSSHMLNQSNSPSNWNEECSFKTGPISQYLFINVMSSPPPIGELYNLTISRTFLPPPDDYQEQNDFQGQSKWLGLPAYNASLVALDLDWFHFNLNNGDQVNITVIGFMPDTFYIDLYNSSSVLITSGTPSGWTSTLIWTASYSGMHYLKIDTMNKMGAIYDLNVTKIGGLPPDDYQEENDILGSARWLTLPAFNASLVAIDLDWFYFQVNQGDQINITVNWFMPDTLYPDLYYGNSSWIAQGSQNGWSMNILWTATENGNLYLKIDSMNKMGTTYNLGIIINGGGPADDMYEENDEFGNAADINNPFFNGSLVMNDLDYYRLWLTIGVKLNVSVISGAPTTFSVDFYDGSQMWIENGDNLGGRVTMLYNITQSDWYYIKVNAAAQSGYIYALNVTNASYDDSFEENDAFGSARWLNVPASQDNLVMNDDDWFYISLTMGQQVNITTLSLENEYVYIELRNSGNAWLKYSGMWGAISVLEWTASYTGNHYIRVYGSFYNGSKYDLDILEVGGDDAYEENDDFNNAYHLTIPANIQPVVSKDHDWFNFTVTAGDTINITASTINDDYLYLSLFNATYHWQVNGSNGWKFSNLTWIASKSETLVLRVLTQYFNGAVYSLNIQVQSAGPTDDSYEENDGIDDAKTLTPFPGTVNNLIQKDIDFFKFQITGCSNVTIVLTDNSIVATNFEVFNASDLGKPKIGNSIAVGWQAQLSLCLTPGEYIIKVFGDNNGLTYSLSTTVVAENCCCLDDTLEDNDLYSSAKLLSTVPVILNNLSNCDDDWYSFNVLDNKRVDVFVFLVGGNGVLVLSEYGPNQQYMNQDSTSSDGSLQLIINLTIGGAVYILINGTNVGQKYNLDIRITDIPAVTNTTTTTSTSTATNSSTTSSTNSSSTPGTENPFGSVPGYPVEMITIVSIVAFALIIKKKSKKIQL